MIRGLYLDPVAHDVVIGSTGGLTWVDDPRTATVQEIKTRMLFLRGENFLNLREGTPYYQEILKKNPNLGRVRAIFRAVLLSVPSVTDVPRLEVTVDGATREATVVWTVRTDDGLEIRSEDFPALLIQPAKKDR